jgi:hypothetical protein
MDEFEGIHSPAPIERVMDDSVRQLVAGRTEVHDFVPTLAHRLRGSVSTHSAGRTGQPVSAAGRGQHGGIGCPRPTIPLVGFGFL